MSKLLLGDIEESHRKLNQNQAEYEPEEGTEDKHKKTQTPVDCDSEEMGTGTEGSVGHL